MKFEDKFFASIIALWLFGILLSLAATCGIIWFAIWCAKHYGLF